MSDTVKPHPRVRVTDSIQVAYHGNQVHLEIGKHLSDDVFQSAAWLLTKETALALSAALAEMAGVEDGK